MNDAPKLEAVPDLPGAVLLNQAENTISISDLTFIDLVGLAFTKADEFLKSEDAHPAAKREYALTKTHLEDATFRFNRGRSLDLGVFHVSDLEDPEFLAAIAAAQTPKGGEDQ